MNREIQQRLQWVHLYEDSGDAGFVCRRCGISRPKLRKWRRHYQEHGVDGPASRSRRPHSSPNIKAGRHEEQLVLDLRTDRNLGAGRIQSELRRLHAISLSLATIHKILHRNHVRSLKKYCTKFRPNKPGSPHLDGKIERSHWPHCAHHGKSPMERYFDMASETPLSEEAYEGYNPASERIQDPNYSVDLESPEIETISMNHTDNNIKLFVRFFAPYALLIHSVTVSWQIAYIQRSIR